MPYGFFGLLLVSYYAGALKSRRTVSAWRVEVPPHSHALTGFVVRFRARALTEAPGHSRVFVEANVSSALALGLLWG